MERDTRNWASSVESSSNSGVYRAVTPHVIAELSRDLKASTTRVSVFRAGITDRHNALGVQAEEDLAWQALQEIDAAHEELRVAEEELHTQADELLATRMRLDRERRVFGELFEAAPEAYLVTDDRGVIIQANRRAATLVNLDQALLIGKPLVSLVAHDDRRSFFNLLEAVGDAVFHTELRIVPRKQPDAVWVALSAQRGIRDEGSLCVRWLMRSIAHEKEDELRRNATEKILRDRIRTLEVSVASLTQSVERAQLARQEADDRDRRKSVALAETAHEMRSPLSTIAGWLRMLHEGMLEEKTQARAVDSMTRCVRSIVRIVENLIDHARAENDQLVLKLETLNLVRSLFEVVEDMRPLAELKKLRIAFSAKSSRLVVRGDGWRLQQVFKNLIGNAVKFTPEHGAIQVSVSTTELHAEVKVTDTGRGIPADALRAIFTPFTQLGAPGTRHTGLGLGLSIARRIVELHGGTICAESDGPGTGSTFTVRLPLLAPN